MPDPLPEGEDDDRTYGGGADRAQIRDPFTGDRWGQETGVAGDPAADEAADDAENHGPQPATFFLAGQDPAGEATGDESEDEPTGEFGHGVNFMESAGKASKKAGDIGISARGGWRWMLEARGMDDTWFKQASRRKRYLVGVSGGADSVALLEMLLDAGFRKLVVCHLDHGWRGADSRADAEWVRRLAARHGLEFELGRGHLVVGPGMEAKAREARHEFFGACAARRRCPRLLLAHHAEDQAETVLWNLLRGSRGPCGMQERRLMRMAGRAIEVMRPLLSWRRKELREWLAMRGVKWREDGTNALPIVVRNRLRHEAMPLLEEITGRDCAEPLVRTAAATAELREIEAWAVAEAGAVDPQGRLHVGRLLTLPPALRRSCVFAFMTGAGLPDLGRAELDRVMSILEPNGPPRVSLPGGRLARRRGGRLWIEGLSAGMTR